MMTMGWAIWLFVNVMMAATCKTLLECGVEPAWAWTIIAVVGLINVCHATHRILVALYGALTSGGKQLN